ncbi:hypothetical protein VZT92_012601 [Zoarces viviparus]|uniref:Uncharacterized protein n=1 Tax=Zoarces viviparus TaxID=48416 RepID=A0AAW1F0V9_ZOAVI
MILTFKLVFPYENGKREWRLSEDGLQSHPAGQKKEAKRSFSLLWGFRVEGGSSQWGLTLHDPVTGAQYVQIQLLQDDPASDGDLAFQLSSQPSSSHSQLTADLPVNILQEPSVMTEDDNGSDNSQFTGSTINLQDLE